jgi:hypothetical protein
LDCIAVPRMGNLQMVTGSRLYLASVRDVPFQRPRSASIEDLCGTRRRRAFTRGTYRTYVSMVEKAGVYPIALGAFQ